MDRLRSIFKHIDLAFKDKITFLRILQSYFKKKFLKKSVLRKVDIAITYNCNANCKHCSVGLLKDTKKQFLSIKEIKRCIKESIKLGVIAFEFTGGEPLLRNEIYETVEFAKSNHSIVGLTTNGLLLNEDLISRLKRAGLDVVQVSLDSIIPQRHDESRGALGSFYKVLDCIELAKKYKIKLMLSTIVTDQNISDGSIHSLIKFIQIKKILLSLNAACPVGRWTGDSKVVLSERFKDIYNNLLKQPFVRWAGHMNFSKEACPCGVETLYITAYGDVIPCGFIQVSYGNIRYEPLDKIWERMFQHHRLICNERTECIATLNKNFINKYIEPLRFIKKLPIYFEDHPCYLESNNIECKR